AQRGSPNASCSIALVHNRRALYSWIEAGSDIGPWPRAFCMTEAGSLRCERRRMDRTHTTRCRCGEDIFTRAGVTCRLFPDSCTGGQTSLNFGLRVFALSFSLWVGRRWLCGVGICGGCAYG
ncbi:hypothetical protein RSAG8_03758, partial [Rhizoctonia solani AG-8 WAC10335]